MLNCFLSFTTFLLLKKDNSPLRFLTLNKRVTKTSPPIISIANTILTNTNKEKWVCNFPIYDSRINKKREKDRKKKYNNNTNKGTSISPALAPTIIQLVSFPINKKE